MHHDPERNEVEMMDDGTDVGLLPPEPSGWSDPLTGTDGPRLWDRVVSSEVSRVQRTRRPTTVALVEMAGFDDLARADGSDVAERLFVKIARALAVEIRASDHIARIERTRFGIMLTETDEIEAINVVERVRDVCEMLLQGHDHVRVGIGWASPASSADLREAIDVAVVRLLEELHPTGMAYGGEVAGA